MSHFDDVLDEFDRLIGLDKLHAIHLNDSKKMYKVQEKTVMKILEKAILDLKHCIQSHIIQELHMFLRF